MKAFVSIHIGSDCRVTCGKHHAANDTWEIFQVAHAKGFGKNAISNQPIERNSLFIPCSPEVIQRIQDFLDMQKLLNISVGDSGERSYAGPYYFSQEMTADRKFEFQNHDRRLLGHPFSAHANAIQSKDNPSFLQRLFNHRQDYKKIDLNETHISASNPERIPFARFNCWTKSQGLTQYIGGIDLSEVDADLPFYYRAKHAGKWLEKAFKGKTRASKIADAGNHTVLMRGQYGIPFLLLKKSCSINELLDIKVDLEDRPTLWDYLKILDEKFGFAKTKDIASHIHVTSASKGPRLKF